MKVKVAIALAAVLGITQSSLAHHSYAMFDGKKENELKGATVVEWQWTSPHTWLYVLVPNGTGTPDKYSLEGGNPGVLRRVGFNKGSLSPGDKITVYMSPLRSGEKGGALNAVLLPDGKMLGKRIGM